MSQVDVERENWHHKPAWLFFFQEEKHSIQVLNRASWCGGVCPCPWWVLLQGSFQPKPLCNSMILWNWNGHCWLCAVWWSHSFLIMGKVAEIWQTLCVCFPKKRVFLFRVLKSHRGQTASLSTNGVADFQVFGHTEIMKDVFREERFWSHTFCF